MLWSRPGHARRANGRLAWFCSCQSAKGRHAKDRVRIRVGQVKDSLIAVLLGPNDEVKMSMEVLVKGLQSGLKKHVLAEQIATCLRDKLLEKMRRWSHQKAH